MDNDVTEVPLPAKPDRTLIAILIAVGLLVVIALVVVLIRNGASPSYDPKSPEGVVQAYARSVIDGDDTAAAAFLSARPEECDYFERSDDSQRLAFRSTKISGTTATVRVTISTTYSYGGGPFSTSDSTVDDEFRLVRSGDSWLISKTPYQFISCGIPAGS